MSGRQPTERERAALPKKVVVGRDWVETSRSGGGHWVGRYGWGDEVKQIGKGGFAAYLYVTHKAESGASGGNGGNSGLAGKPGNGGNGGSVTVRSLGDFSVTIKTDLGAGEKGAQARSTANRAKEPCFLDHGCWTGVGRLNVSLALTRCSSQVIGLFINRTSLMNRGSPRRASNLGSVQNQSSQWSRSANAFSNISKAASRSSSATYAMAMK